MTALETAAARPRANLTRWTGPALIALTGVGLLILSLAPFGGSGVSKHAPIGALAAIDVTVPARDRGVVRNWCSFFRAYGLSDEADKDRVVRATLLAQYRSDPAIEFLPDKPIKVFFEPPTASTLDGNSVDEAAERAVVAKMREINAGC